MASINIFIHEMWTADFYYTVVFVLVFCLSADHEDSPIVRTCMVRLYPNTVFLAVSNYHINFILMCRVENVFFAFF